jgi:hypothetical protein
MRPTQVILRGTLALATGVILSGGCVDNDTTIFVRQCQAIVVDDECIVTNDPSALALTSGTLDVSFGDSVYVACMLVGNQLVPRGNPDRTLPESSRVHFYKVDVEVLDAAENFVTSFTVPVSGFADPAAGSEPGFGWTCAPILDAGSAQAFAAAPQIAISRIKVYGRSLGGLELETDWWDFPIFVCNGCLGCNEPQDCEDELGQVCQYGQDEVPDCRVVGRSQLCPAP